MGQGRSQERQEKAVKQLSGVELANIEAVFHEIATKLGDGTKGVELSVPIRQELAERFRLPGFVAERLFHVFDKNEDGTITLEEFVGGIALCLHGTVKDKCRLLFHVFNLADDDGVSEEELSTVLYSSLSSAVVILNSVEANSDDASEVNEEDKLIETVQRIVKDAFAMCDVSRTGKLSSKEFEKWLFQNPHIMDNVFGWQCPRPQEGHWTNEGELRMSADPGADALKQPETALHYGGEPQSVPLQVEESAQTLSNLFSSSHTQGGDTDGQSFFDSIATTNDEIPPNSTQPHDPEQLAISSPRTRESGTPSSASEPDEPAQREAIPSRSMLQHPLQTQDELEPLHLESAEKQTIQASQISSHPGNSVLDTMRSVTDPLLGHSVLDDRSSVSAPPTSGDDEEERAKGKLAEVDCHHAAWIPSLETKQLLATIGSGMLDPADVEQRYLTSPGLVLEGSQGDPVKDLLSRFVGEQGAEKRKTPTVDSVPLDASGLRDLLQSECWRAALDFTARFLTAHGQGTGQQGQRALHTHKTLQVWFCRIALLFKLQMYSTAEAELERFGKFDQPDLYYEYYPDTYPGRKGSLVPFSLRILGAALPQFMGRANDALDGLFELQKTCRQVMDNLKQGCSEDGTAVDMPPDETQAAIDLWESRDLRVLYCIGNCFLAMKDYSLAVSIFESILQKEPSNAPELLSGIGRIYLQLGDLERAQCYFKRVEAKATGHPKTLGNIVMNKGFTALASGAYDEAHRHFLAVTKLDPENSVAVNNVAVCLLFMGRLKEALRALEMALVNDPPRNLHEGLLFNLCTIYELESSFSLQKKQKLLELVAQYKGDGFNVSCLKIA